MNNIQTLGTCVIVCIHCIYSDDITIKKILIDIYPYYGYYLDSPIFPSFPRGLYCLPTNPLREPDFAFGFIAPSFEYSLWLFAWKMFGIL
jgi:hypothetical protein